RNHDHRVDVIAPTDDDMRSLARSRVGLRARVSRRLSGRKSLPHMWDLVADRIEPRVRCGGYDIIIARSPDVATVLTRDVRGTKIYDMANVSFLEEYYSGCGSIDDVENTYQREIRI